MARVGTSDMKDGGAGVSNATLMHKGNRWLSEIMESLAELAAEVRVFLPLQIWKIPYREYGIKIPR